MFEKLQQKWKVSGWQLFLILCVFAITGTLTAYISRQITGWLQIDRTSPWFWALKIAVLIFGYQVLILLISFPFGQFKFFWNYEKKILRRFGINFDEQASEQGSPRSNVQGPGLRSQTLDIGPETLDHVRIAVFASGAGSNAQKIIDHFRNHPFIRVELIICNKAGAGVLGIAEKENIAYILIDKEKFFRGNAYIDELRQYQIDFVVLAGFLWKIPSQLVKAFPERIINIHPALLPKYGGKGMYGGHVHEAVLAAKDRESGITIHYVDEQYDHGQHIFQAACSIDETDTPSTLAQKVHALEHLHFPRVIEEVIQVQTGR